MTPLLLAAALTCFSPVPVDADTLRDCQGQRVRLWGIDAADPAVPAATRAVAALLAGKSVVCRIPPSGQDRDRYGRAVRQCEANGTDIAAEITRSGWASDWPRYSSGAYADEELEARRGKRGLWGG